MKNKANEQAKQTDSAWILDDQINTLNSYKDYFNEEEIETDCFQTGKELLGRLSERGPDKFTGVLLVDIRLGDTNMNGYSVIAQVKEMDAEIPVIIFTGHGEATDIPGALKEARSALKDVGANDIHIKPLHLEEALQNGEDLVALYEKPSDVRQLVTSVRQACSNRRLILRNRMLQKELAATREANKLIYGSSQAVRKLQAEINKIANGHSTVLIYGESGTGKELVAREIFQQSLVVKGLSHEGKGKEARFVSVNCAFKTDTMIESELFGHEKGAFTGATDQRIGALELANHGVLFLDEIGKITLETQGKLLRALQEREFPRLGGNKLIPVNFQLVCAVNLNPEQMMKDGKLTEDFYYRINTVRLNVPPLRDRREDIPLLAEMFLQQLKTKGLTSYPGDRFSEDSIRLMQEYHWPGNVRELQNFVERSLIFSKDKIIDIDSEEELSDRALAVGRNSKAEPDNFADGIRWLAQRTAEAFLNRAALGKDEMLKDTEMGRAVHAIVLRELEEMLRESKMNEVEVKRLTLRALGLDSIDRHRNEGRKRKELLESLAESAKFLDIKESA